MINNLMVVGRQYDYGYDSYYLARKDESVDFPSNLAMIKVLSPTASDYTVESVPLTVTTSLKGTLKSTSYTPSGYLSKVTKHFIVNNEVLTGVLATFSGSGAYDYEYTMTKSPVVTGTLSGYIFNDGEIIQKFTVEKGSTNLVIVDEVEDPTPKVSSGSYTDDVILLTWTNTPTDGSLVVSYEYESEKASSVLTSTAPVVDDYDFVDLYGITTLDTKFIKIMSTFKCKYKQVNGQFAYTNTKSKLFYTRCRSFQSLCSSKSNGYVPATTICSEKLF